MRYHGLELYSLKKHIPLSVGTTARGFSKIQLVRLSSCKGPISRNCPIGSGGVTVYDPKLVEKDKYAWWETKQLFKPEFKKDGTIKDRGLFTIPSPPPNITGVLHIGHALAITLQDILVRYNKMLGKTTLFIPGFDHAGIATQSVVEKSLWKTEGRTRESYTRKEFVEKIQVWKDTNYRKIKSQFKVMGGSYDWSREAFTMDTIRTNAVNHAFVELFDEGLVYRANKLINWSTKLQTVVSNIEVDKREIKGCTLLEIPNYEEPIKFGVLYNIRYEVIGSKESIIVSTTRPETIFGDVAIAVHPLDGRYKHLHGGKNVKHPLLDKQIPIILDNVHVDMEFGTGAVKITPGHDFQDYALGIKHELPSITIFHEDGTLNELCGSEWSGMKRFDARKEVIKRLKQNGTLVSEVNYDTVIPICSRSGDVIEPMLKEQWFLNQSPMVPAAIRMVQDGKIKIQPKRSQTEYINWLNKIEDWCISRQLWWGHQCPVYLIKFKDNNRHLNTLDKCNWIAGETDDIAMEKAKLKYPNAEFELVRDEDVLDTWFSSALWPISILGWPQETIDLKDFYPFSILESGWDILFFWITKMILLNIKLTGQIPFKEVFCHPLVRDSEGRKMSKSLGNVIDPMDIINGVTLKQLEHKLRQSNLSKAEIDTAVQLQRSDFPNGIPACGTDALRFTLCSYVHKNNDVDINLDIGKIIEYRRFINKIYQSVQFLLKRRDRATETAEYSMGAMDKWMVDKMSSYVMQINKSIQDRNFSGLANMIYEMWYSICDNYIEYVKYNPSSVLTLEKVIHESLLISHPVMPYVTEELYQKIKSDGSVSLSILQEKYPEVITHDRMFEEDSVKCEKIWLIIKCIRSLSEKYVVGKGKNHCFIHLPDNSNNEGLKDAKPFIVFSTRQYVKDITVTYEPVPDTHIGKQVDKEISISFPLDIEDEAESRKMLEQKLDKIEYKLTKLRRAIESRNYQMKVNDKIKEMNRDKMERLNIQKNDILTILNRKGK